MELIALLMSGGNFTYRNFRENEAFSKLDRFLVSEEILDRHREMV